MNRAAEEAAPASREVLKSTINGLKFEDVQVLWKGGQTAITDFFHEKMSNNLKTAFTPIVGKAIEQNGVARNYEKLHHSSKSIPFFWFSF